MTCPSCEFDAGIYHTNGAWECYRCSHIVIPAHLREVYNGPAYEGRITVAEPA